MFTQRKKNYRTFIYTAIILTLCFLIIAIAWPSSPDDRSEYGHDQKVNAGISADSESELDKEDSQEDEADTDDDDEKQSSAYGSDDDRDHDDEDFGDEDFDGEDNFPLSENNDITGESQSYYLVKKAGDAIKVFFVDHSGNEVELETTGILYEMLGYEDQAMFERGYRVSSQEELAVLLQDFES